MVKISFKEYREAAGIVEKSGRGALAMKLVAKAAEEQKKHERGKQKAHWICGSCNSEVTITTQKVCDNCQSIDTVRKME